MVLGLGDSGSLGEGGSLLNLEDLPPIGFREPAANDDPGKTVVLFPFVCSLCPGDGVRRAKRPGVDWPTPCSCEARKTFSQYQLARVLEEEPETIVRLHSGRTTPRVSYRILEKLTGLGLL